MKKRGKIRVAIVRCDVHGYWYAPFFQAPDPARFRETKNGCGIHYYFYEPSNPQQLRFPPMPGFEITRVWDEDRVLAEELASSYPPGQVKVCDTFDEASDDVDLVFIPDCSFEGKDHLKLATPGLRKGIPTFVDKPFAYTLADARRIVNLAKKHDTVMTCSSLMRRSPFFERFRIRMEDVAPVGSVMIKCGGPSLAGIFHGVSLVQHLMGMGCEWVESMGETLFDAMRFHYPKAYDGVNVCMLNARGKAPHWHGLMVQGYAHDYHHCRYDVSALGADGSIHSRRVDDFTFLYAGEAIVKMIRKMVRTGTPPVPYDEMLELMAIIEAARKAHNTGKRFYLKDIQ